MCAIRVETGGEIAHKRATDGRGTLILVLREASKSCDAVHGVRTAGIALCSGEVRSGKSAGSVINVDGGVPAAHSR
jgi:hypothetical protein